MGKEFVIDDEQILPIISRMHQSVERLNQNHEFQYLEGMEVADRINQMMKAIIEVENAYQQLLIEDEEKLVKMIEAAKDIDIKLASEMDLVASVNSSHNGTEPYQEVGKK